MNLDGKALGPRNKPPDMVQFSVKSLTRPWMSPSPARPRSSIRVVLTTLVAVTLIVTACGGEPVQGLGGMVRTPPPDVSSVVLPDVSNDGGEFTMTAEPGHVLVVYFGYTSCPDVCPTTMADLRRAMADLGDRSELVDVAFVTVDPNRDTAERFTAYVHAFFDRGHALRTEDPAALESAAKTFGASYEVRTGGDGTVEVAHSAFLYAIDSTGHIVVQWPFGTTSQDMNRDLSTLLRRDA